jgi:hypothetical protein
MTKEQFNELRWARQEYAAQMKTLETQDKVVLQEAWSDYQRAAEQYRVRCQSVNLAKTLVDKLEALYA